VLEAGALVRMTTRVNKAIPFQRKLRMVVLLVLLLMEIHNIARTILAAVTIHRFVVCSIFLVFSQW